MVNKSREKETERDLSDKKHRKSSTANTNDIPTIKASKEDVYANVVAFEEEESKKRSAEKDSALFLDTCAKLKKIFAEIAELKGQSGDRVKEQINEKRIQGSFLFALLKKLNRLDKVRSRAGRDTLHKEKLSVDSNKLQLQNLLYEADHLRKEVQHCLQFKSHDEEIDLVSESEFYREAPESISRRDKTEHDEHARRLARLEWELQQRKELAAMCKELQAAKETVAQEIESKTNRLDSLMPCLDALLKATRPLQEALEINSEKRSAVFSIAKLLPQPLYVAYMNLSAYADTSDKYLTTIINGDEEEARDLENVEKISTDEVDETSQDSENDDNDQEQDSEHKSKKHHRRRQSTIATAEVNVFKPHPLSVTFKVSTPSSPGSLSVTLYYLPTLHFITVATTLANIDTNSFAARDVLDSNNILSALMSNESDADEMLHPKTIYTLQKLSLDTSKFLMKLGEQSLGKPYKWAQNLCGISLMSSRTPNTNTTINNEITQAAVPNIVKKIRTRLNSRVQLCRQVTDLERKNIDALMGNEGALGMARVSCTLVQWSPITWPEYCERNIVTGKFVDSGFVTANHLLYCAIIIRGSAKLECFVSISPNFPSESPLWAISLSWNGVHNAINNTDIREMESWINSIESNKKNATYILGLQLKRTMCSLDIYLETEGIRSAPAGIVEFPPEKTFMKAFRGRAHSRPYNVVQNSGSIIYTQIQ